MVNIYVGNLSYTCTDAELEQAFSPHGEVSAARVIIDRQTGRSRGFGFVEMATEEEAQKAIEAMNGADMGGRALKVNIARERS